MSIVFENHNTSSNRIQRPGFRHGGMSCIAIYGDRRYPAVEEAKGLVQARVDEEEEDTCSSSSIGRNSDSGESSDGGGDSGDGEVQSDFKGPLDCLDALEEVLPMKRGISTFYSGKSKSFTSLADISSCSSVKDIAKPEDAYTRKRKNLLAHTNFFDKSRTNPSRTNSGSISKRLAHSNRTTLGLGFTMNRSDSTSNIDSTSSTPSPPSLGLPPRVPQTRKSLATPANESGSSVSPPVRNFSSWRSFSLSDLQGAAAESEVLNV
ncbi:hypothetical protein LguiA_003117 [Lonicera macranthoides]